MQPRYALRCRVELRERQPWLVATVPPQHMYGLKLSVLLPLLGGIGVHASHPLYPADIASALAEVPEPRVLVSTPVHLRALLESGVRLPPLQVIVSATAPLSADLAGALERRIGTVLLEFFGSTETCVIASRRTATVAAWRPHRGRRAATHERRHDGGRALVRCAGRAAGRPRDPGRTARSRCGAATRTWSRWPASARRWRT